MSDVSALQLDALTGQASAWPKESGLIVSQDNFTIRLADTEHGRNRATMLVNRMFSWRGYGDGHVIPASGSKVTLTASAGGETVGTLTLCIDGDDGLAADVLFKDEIDLVRRAGGKACEFVKLAIDRSVQTRAHFAALCHVAFICARDIHGCTDLFVEVNPRHRRFYEGVFGFERRADPRQNLTVGAPAYLMHLNLASMHPSQAAHDEGAQSLIFKHAFSPGEVEGIRQRLLSLEVSREVRTGLHREGGVKG